MTASAQKSTERFRGSVKWYDENKGYGFIVPDGSRGKDADIFVHVSQLQASRIKADALFEGVRIEFSTQKSDRPPYKPMAVDLKVLD